ncbi:MAG: hypothetical protein ABSF15_13970 [Candidatus Sulfotelmatobacter sp.]
MSSRVRRIDSNIDRDGRAQVFERLIALGWLAFQKKLIDDYRGVGMFPQLGNGLLKIFSPMGFAAGRSVRRGQRTLDRVLMV